MSLFEELIDELKQENLLEETVLPPSRGAAAAPSRTIEPASGSDLELESADSGADENFAPSLADEREAHRRRAMDEVTSLQMVEHVLSGIEREHMKMSPHTFDDLNVKKALHKYLQVNSPISSDEHSAAELELYHETEKWFSALARRDGNISVANVRRFCENSRPVLSSQALISLARFYRNSPYNEAARGKFDFVMTKLFSREMGGEKRRLLFGRAEMLTHIKALYSNWASLSLSSEEEIGGDFVTGFESLLQECQAAESFDALISTEFFNRIRLYKESAAEVFFEPPVIAAAMECNVGIGNRFVDLLYIERQVTGESAIEERYGYNYDTIISGAASKTLLLLDLLRDARELDPPPPAAVQEVRPASETDPVITFERAPVSDRQGGGVNKWFVAVMVVVLLLSASVYFWSENATAPETGIETAVSVDVSGSELTQHVREASKSNETFYGVMQPTWEALSQEEQTQFLGKTVEFAKAKGLKKVNLLNARGRTVAYASETRQQLFGPQ